MFSPPAYAQDLVAAQSRMEELERRLHAATAASAALLEESSSVVAAARGAA